MRHLKKGRKLNRKSEHRNAMFNNMLESFFQYERIQTTAAKAKELRSLSEKMITRAKQNTLHSKRIVLKRLHNRDIVAKLFDEIAPKYQDVHGGYTRILKVRRRKGDGAQLSLLELVDVEEAAAKTTKKTEAPTAERAEKPEPKPSKAKTATTGTKSAPSPQPGGTKTQAQSSASSVKEEKAKASVPKPRTAKPKASAAKPPSSAAKQPSSAARQHSSTPKSKPEKPDAKDKA